MEVKLTDWNGLRAERLTGGDYEAIILPELGANCISLIHKPSGSRLLRVPKTREEIIKGCYVYGLPLLFPPNRVRDGRYTFENREYAFPINEPSRGNHIHGFLAQTEFEAMGDGIYEYRAAGERGYLSFPHDFLIKRQYDLSCDGLVNTISVTNMSAQRMPLGIGIHAALRAEPSEDCRLQMEPLCRWAVDPVRLLPTGERLADEPLLMSLKNGTLDPGAEPISALIEIKPGSEITLREKTGAWHCLPDCKFKFIMLWNGGGKDGFICPEPQSWATDAPNLPMPSETTGFSFVEPGAVASYRLTYRFTEE